MASTSQLLSFICEVKDQLGNTLSSSFNCDVIAPQNEAEIQEGVDPPFRRVLAVLSGMRKGQSREIRLKAEEAYGLYDDKLVVTVPRQTLELEDSVEIGSEVMGESDSGEPHLFRVVGVGPQGVTLDGNHPLAGRDLVVSVKVTATKRVRNRLEPSNGPSYYPEPSRLLH
jgi:FKBP-type peptidyl-prolyl cis-trans isomerase 2